MDSTAETLGPGAGAPSAPVIDNLGLTGDTLTWDRAGKPQTAQLQ